MCQYQKKDTIPVTQILLKNKQLQSSTGNEIKQANTKCYRNTEQGH